ncbi:ABC transporter substrate-binding protein [Devosia litorisediminis]|uniref:ABC transporter substrate-binding protein n=1 Tax=Devosia litorisediminis TaxID=2829817 RepID=UPI0031F42093
MTVSTLLGDYPITHAFKAAAATSDVAFDFLPGKPVTYFRRFFQKLDIDIAEVPIMTFLIARERGVPVALLPAIVLGGSQHEYLFRNATSDLGSPADLAGRRIGVRSYSVTTVAWLRDILQREHGVDPSTITWVTFEPPHLPILKDLPNVVAAPAGISCDEMLAVGQLDAAVLRAVPTGRNFVHVIEDPVAAGDAWCKREAGLQINHMVAVPRAFASANPEAVSAFMAGLRASARRAGKENLIGLDSIRHSLELSIQCAVRQGLIHSEPQIDQLFAQSSFGP